MAYQQPVIFLCYRRNSTQDVVDRLRERLARELGPKAIFRDIESIEPGEKIWDVIEKNVKSCRVALVVIGKDCLNAENRKRLETPGDFVRYEIETALAHAFVIPVLVQGITYDSLTAGLPQELRSLAGMKFSPVRRDPEFDGDMQDLILAIEKRLALLESPPSAAVEAAAPSMTPAGASSAKLIRIIPHSTLFYWWPVWTLALSLGFITIWQDSRLIIVPPKTSVTKTDSDEFILKSPVKDGLQSAFAQARGDPQNPFPAKVTSHGLFGTFFVLVLVGVILITNLRLRSIQSYAMIASVLTLVVMLSLLGRFTDVVTWIGSLPVYISDAGYFIVGCALFLIWSVAVIYLDRQTYALFTDSEIRICPTAGAEELSFPIVGTTIVLQRDDLFRHWVLGQGSGDLIVRTTGSTGREFLFSNVLFVGHKLQALEQLYRDQPLAIVGTAEIDRRTRRR